MDVCRATWVCLILAGLAGCANETQPPSAPAGATAEAAEPNEWSAWSQAVDGIQFRFMSLADGPSHDAEDVKKFQDWVASGKVTAAEAEELLSFKWRYLPVMIEMRNVGDAPRIVRDPGRLPRAEATILFGPHVQPEEWQIWYLEPADVAPDDKVNWYALLRPGQSLLGRLELGVPGSPLARCRLYLHVPCGWLGDASAPARDANVPARDANAAEGMPWSAADFDSWVWQWHFDRLVPIGPVWVYPPE